MNRIAESGSSASPLVVEAATKEEEEEIVVKEVISIPEKKETVKKKATLRIGSEGDEIQAIQVWLLLLASCVSAWQLVSSFTSPSPYVSSHIVNLG